MAENSYAQLIDDFENGINVLKGETLTEYIKRMGGVDYESKADGGAIGIEVLFTDKKAKGGRVGLKAGTNPFKKKTNVQKIKETFGPKKRVNAKGGKLIGGQKKTYIRCVQVGLMPQIYYLKNANL